MVERNGNGSEDPGKRLAILEQAIQTFAELGFRGADVQVIADRASVGKGTVYRYFHNKEDLFWAASFEVLLRLEQSVFGAMDGIDGAIAKIRAAAIAYAQFFETNPQYLEVFVQGRAELRSTGPESHRAYHRQMTGRLEDVLHQGIDAGEIRPLDTQHTTHALGSLMYGIVVLGCHLTSLPPREMAEHSVDIFLRGLRAETSCLAGESQREHIRDR
jgi:AcrR family transcriptional regulator